MSRLSRLDWGALRFLMSMGLSAAGNYLFIYALSSHYESYAYLYGVMNFAFGVMLYLAMPMAMKIAGFERTAIGVYAGAAVAGLGLFALTGITTTAIFCFVAVNIFIEYLAARVSMLGFIVLHRAVLFATGILPFFVSDGAAISLRAGAVVVMALLFAAMMHRARGRALAELDFSSRDYLFAVLFSNAWLYVTPMLLIGSDSQSVSKIKYIVSAIISVGAMKMFDFAIKYYTLRSERLRIDVDMRRVLGGVCLFYAVVTGALVWLEPAWALNTLSFGLFSCVTASASVFWVSRLVLAPKSSDQVTRGLGE